MARIRSIHPEQWRGSHWVYVIKEHGGPVKIGAASNPAYRLSDLQSGNHRQLRLVETIPTVNKADSHKIEFLVHAKFNEFRVAREWFDVSTDDAVEAIREEWRILYGAD